MTREMKFEVTRTSLSVYGREGSPEDPPCHGAVFDGDRWMIEFQDLDAMAAFIRENKRVVVATTDAGDYLVIEIYDDCRE